MSLSETSVELMFGTVRRPTDKSVACVGFGQKQSAAQFVRPIAGTEFHRTPMFGLMPSTNVCPLLFPTQHATSTYAVFEITVVLIELPPLESLVAMVCPWRTPSTVQLASGAAPVRLTMT